MSNQPLAHVADERAAFEAALSGCFPGLPGRNDSSASVAKTVGWAMYQCGLARAAGAPAETPKPFAWAYRTIGKGEWRATMDKDWATCIAGMECKPLFDAPQPPAAPAETPKLISKEWCQKMASREIKFDGNIEAGAETPKPCGSVTVEDGCWISGHPDCSGLPDGTHTIYAAQPAPAPATDARELKAIDLGHGARLQRSTKTTGGVTWLMYNEHGLVRSLSVSEVQIVQATIAAMLSANSPREAG